MSAGGGDAGQGDEAARRPEQRPRRRRPVRARLQTQPQSARSSAPTRAQARTRDGHPTPWWGTSWRAPERGLLGSAIVLVFGLVLVGLAPSELGAAATLLGAVGFLLSIHRYGRLGPEGPRAD